MIQTFAKLRGMPFGRGVATISFTKGFRKVKPADRMSMLTQWMKQARAEYDLAESQHRISRQHEDAANAERMAPARAGN